MNLFILNRDTYEVDIDPTLTLINPFKKIIDRDKTLLKKKAKAELAYIYFMCDYKSDFITILDEEIKKQEIIASIEGLDSTWKEDKVIKQACEFYIKRRETLASIALDTQTKIVHKLLAKIETFADDDDAAVVQKATAMAEKIKNLITQINDLEKVVKGQQELIARHRGSQEKGMMEDDD